MLNEDYSDMLSALNAAGAEYLVVGAFAVAAHGLPRATCDLDIWVRADAANAARVMVALSRFGAPLRDLSEQDLASPDVVYQIGVAPRRIDLMTSLSGVTFEEAWVRRLETDLDGLRVTVVGMEDLIKNKRAVGRTKDRTDVRALERKARRG